MENIPEIDISGLSYQPNLKRYRLNGTTLTYKAHRANIAMATYLEIAEKEHVSIST